ncbi:MAG: UDP-N-acetylmuramate--L-alanine ligase [Planctomycetes bacterium]|nr:UDP-N-acetylmuramate--L-alanine ligase [Planctomycetota bacterium]
MSRSSVKTPSSGVPAQHTVEPLREGSHGLALDGERFHLIGIGGMGMSALALVLARSGAVIRGSDQTSGASTALLEARGVQVCLGHSAENLQPGFDRVVVSAAINGDNPELLHAQRRGCKVYKYAQMLGELFNRCRGIAISGTHGKSTTSAWLTYVLQQAGVDVDFVIGASTDQLVRPAGSGPPDYFIAEACEYDRSFLNLRPHIACILNIEPDHLDYYRDEAEIVSAFAEFAAGIEEGGVLVAHGQDANVMQVITQLHPRPRNVTIGLDPSCDVFADHIVDERGLHRFDVYRSGQRVGSTRIGLPGQHNIFNSLAVYAMATEMGLDSEVVLSKLSTFTGIDRRLMFKGRFDDITVIDDYAHHPTEIRASLEAITQRYTPKRIWSVFQPHQYSRTRFLLDAFAESFKLSHVIIVPEIFGVRDSPESRQAVSAQDLVQRLKACGSEAIFLDGRSAICDYLKRHVTAGDLVVTMGAGDVWKVADEYIQRLKLDS